ncbi:hypothetical protein GGX14DRAFT_390375 [Mycena pura]|uniref:Uncharacterized protein n=1 Tax=Mycena pura TaxID=153505 RepID=A0AAD6VNY9_9AGAR|nr:hypothetical protein GGX14DRAFT_390375 [Mycena pura]
MVNTNGANGHDNGTKPPDNILRKTLWEFARREYSAEMRIDELARLHNYYIKPRTLINLNKKFEVPTVKRPPPLAVATAHVANKVAEDLTRRHGPLTIQKQLARQENPVLLPRDMVRALQTAIDPEGAATRFPGRKRPVKVRGQLTAKGIMEEVHCDGHEKLGRKALRMGLAGIDIYGFRDHPGKVLYLTVLPNARDQIAIGHVYLDCLEVNGEFPEQLTFDGGTETGPMKIVQQELRRCLDPDFSELEHPSTVSMSSTDNIPIESLWKYWLDYAGQNIKTAILEGPAKGFAQQNTVHIYLFHWLWPKIVQQELDQFKYHFNTTRRRKQADKLLPTEAPEYVFNNPEKFNLEKLGTPVSKDFIAGLRARLAKPRDEVMRWVPDTFDELALQAYEVLESPPLHFTTGWSTFFSLLPLVESEYVSDM